MIQSKTQMLPTHSFDNNALDWLNECRDTTVCETKKKYNLPWIERFRPNHLDRVVDHTLIINSLKKLIHNKQFPHLLLYGPPGTGKTSTIMLCANELYNDDNYSLMVMEINASDERGIDVVRNKIKNFIETKGVFNKKNDTLFKLVILDEIDSMTPEAQSMLVSIMEKYSLNVRFCILCNYIKKINPCLISRCVTFKFPPLKKQHIEKKILEIAKEIGIKINKKSSDFLFIISRGDMRKVINTMQATYMAFNEITVKNICKCIEYPLKKDVELIHKYLLQSDIYNCYMQINEIIKSKGYQLIDIIHEIFETLICQCEFNEKILNLICDLRNIELNLMMCQNENIQLAGFIGIFKKAY